MDDVLQRKKNRVYLRLSDDDYTRLTKLASTRGHKPGRVAHDLMLEAMEPQIFNERASAVEAMLKEAALKTMDDQTRRLLKEFKRLEINILANLYAMREITCTGFDITPEQFNLNYLEPAKKQAVKELLVDLKRFEEAASG